MRIYVDGNDLLDYFAQQEDPIAAENDRHSSGLPSHKSRGNLTRWLARYCEVRDCDVVLVFDTNPAGQMLSPTEHMGKVTVVNTPYGVEARTEIAGPANRNAVGERTFVVTSNSWLAEALRPGRATTLLPGEFVTRARKLMHKTDEALTDEPDEKFTGLADDEVAFWLRYFRDDD